MNLVIDIGNTNTKIALFKKTSLFQNIRIEKVTERILDELFNDYSIEKIIISKVGKNLSAEIKRVIQNRKIETVYLSHQTSLPIQNNYQTPETLGQDRIAAVVGSYELFNSESCLVIDAGTCITYDFITEQGVYIGGSISPGLMMRYKAMNKFTTALPLLNKQRLNTFVGYNTETSMNTGVQYGLAFEIQGFIEEYINKHGQIKVIMTGGDAHYLASLLKNKIFVCPELVLIGLNKILNYNAKFLE
jgi:type III pantothenate kinase